MGENTIYSSIQSNKYKIDQPQTKSFMVEKLKSYEFKMKKYSVIFAVVITMIGIIRFLIAKLTTTTWNHKEDWIDIIRYIIIGVTICIVCDF